MDKEESFWTLRAAGITDQVQHSCTPQASTHTHTPEHDSHLFHSPFLLSRSAPVLSRDPAPPTRLLLYNSVTIALASAAGQLEELVLAARPCIFKTTRQIQSHHLCRLPSSTHVHIANGSDRHRTLFSDFSEDASTQRQTYSHL